VLLPDVDAQLGFAAEAFGSAPEAVNLWIGDERSTTTFHKDHYENLYCVIRGVKLFHLLPPTDVYRMGLQLYPSAQFQQV
jgi:jumonji domain-containing protein 7